MTREAGTGSYKVVEITDVSDQEIESALNGFAREEYRFESIHFVTQPGNRRPTMAFLFFARNENPAGE
jgi:hypothetical protein